MWRLSLRSCESAQLSASTRDASVCERVQTGGVIFFFSSSPFPLEGIAVDFSTYAGQLPIDSRCFEVDLRSGPCLWLVQSFYLSAVQVPRVPRVPPVRRAVPSSGFLSVDKKFLFVCFAWKIRFQLGRITGHFFTFNAGKERKIENSIHLSSTK